MNNIINLLNSHQYEALKQFITMDVINPQIILPLAIQYNASVDFLNFLVPRVSFDNNLIFYSNSIHTLEFLLSQGIPINTTNDDEDTLFLYSIQENIIDITFLEFLLNRGLDINEADNDGNTALFLTENVNTLTFLLNNGALTDITNNSGYNALIFHITQQTDLEIINILISHTNINFQIQESNITALHVACEILDFKVIKRLLITNDINVNLITNAGFSSYLIYTIYLKNLLIEIDETYLHETLYEFFDITNLFIQKGVNFNLINNDMTTTPLINILSFVADNSFKLRAIKLLLENGADANLSNDLSSPLDIAVVNNSIGHIRELLKHNADINKITMFSPIFYVKSLIVLQFLLKNKANINLEVEEETPLSYYFFRHLNKITKYALSYGAQITPLIIMEHGHNELISAIKTLGLNTDEELVKLFMNNSCFWLRIAYYNNRKVFERFINIYNELLDYKFPIDILTEIVHLQCFGYDESNFLLTDRELINLNLED